jgi:hypothetical protein
MDGRCPTEVYDQSWNGFAKRTTSAAMLDLLLTRQTKPVRVHKNGVNFNGLAYGQYAPELIAHLGKEVYLRVDETVNSVLVWTLDDRFVCVAPANERLPANASRQEMQEAIAAKRHHGKVLRSFYQKRTRLTESLPDLMTRARAESNALARSGGEIPEPPTPPSIRPLRSTLEDQLPAVQRAIEAQPIKAATGTDGRPGRFVYVPSQPETSWEDE